MHYDAFISYSHAADGKLAPALQKALQKLAKRWYRRRSLEVFRDETGLSVDPHLWGAIVKALDESEWFLLLTSPQAAQSEWVGKEIEHWKANRSHDRILPVLTDGHWEWDSETGDFTPDSDAVPAALRGVFTEEPRHLDLRWAHQEDHLDLRNSRFRDAVAEVAAPLHGVTKDAIEGEDVRQHRRTVRIAWTAAASLAVLAVAAVVGAGVAVRNAQHAEQRRIQAVAQRLAAQSQTELARPDLAFLLAANAYRTWADVGTKSALLTAVTNLPEVTERLDTDVPVTAVATVAAADRLWMGTSGGDVIGHRVSDGVEVGRSHGEFGREIVAMAPAESGRDAVVVTDGTAIKTFDGALQPSMVRSTGQPILALAVEQSTGWVAAGTAAGTVAVWEPGSTTPAVTLVAVPDIGGARKSVAALAWTPDRGLLVAGVDGSVRRFDLAAPSAPIWVQQDVAGPSAWATALTVLSDGTTVSGGSDGSVGFWKSADGTPVGALQNVHFGQVRGLAATGDTPGNGSVASVGEDGYLVYWDHLAGSALTAPAPLRVAERVATSVAWDPADPARGIAGGLTGGALLLDYGGTQRRPLAQEIPGWDGASNVAVSPAGDRLAVIRTSGTSKLVSELTITDPKKPDPQARSVSFEGAVERVVFSADGSRALAITSAGLVVIWDGASAQPTLTEVSRAGETLFQLAVSPDGNTVATGALQESAALMSPSAVRLWRLDGQRLVEQGQLQGPTFAPGLAFTPDGSRLVIGGQRSLAIQPVDGGDPVTVALADEDATRSVAVSPDGRTVAVGLWSGPVRLIDAATGATTGDDLRVRARVTDLVFLPDADELVTVSQAGGFTLWDLASRKSISERPLAAVERIVGGVPAAPSLAVGPGFAATASVAEGQLLIWSLRPEDWIAEGCRVHRRDLSESERQRFEIEGAAQVCAPVR